MGVFDFFQQVMNAPSALGEHLATQNLSEQSIAMTKLYGDLKDAEKGDGLASCVMKKAGRAVSDQLPDCNLDSGEVGREAGGKVLAKGIEKAVGSTAALGLSVIKDTAVTAFSLNQSHHEMIELMAKNNVPGFAYQEVELGPIKYKVWVDATAEALKQGGSANVNSVIDGQGMNSADVNQMLDRADREKMRATQEAAKNQALGDMQDYIKDHGVDGYKARLNEAADKMPDMMAQQKAVNAPVPVMAPAPVQPQPAAAVP